ncbi:hypothetical protein F5Y03DRAFT_7303 [Xylaria venustula]|nr:hypothetical protein F5Y03DRAFT_7303 [Xylaria venustula]
MSASCSSINFEGPQVSQADIESFHATHFSGNAISLFDSQFLRPDFVNHGDDDRYCCEEGEEDDELGYYPDGAKRTLTDEQIAIFRHSELEALRRAEREAPKHETRQPDHTIDRTGGEAVHTPIEDESCLTPSDAMDDAAEGSEDGEIETEKPVLTKAELKRQKRIRARQKRKENYRFQPEKKPDLRKRTWDIVDAGMDSLHYDDLGLAHGNGSASTAQRKQISYDD